MTHVGQLAAAAAPAEPNIERRRGKVGGIEFQGVPHLVFQERYIILSLSFDISITWYSKETFL